jgi:choline dehydrogenase-like flavoprotein
MTILTAADLPSGGALRSTVGVVGGGAAGIVVALRLAELGVDCVVCESGADDFDQRTQDLYAGESNGYWDLTETRLRQFGGSTNHFAGQSRPLGRIDLEAAAWRPGQAWPIDHAELARRIPRAAELMGLVPLEVGPDGTWATDPLLPDLPGLDVPPDAARPDDPVFTHQLFQLRAVSMAQNHRDTLAASERATVVFGLNAVSVELVDGGTAVDRVVLATLDGRRVDLFADVFVLATGGIEAPRLLLASTGRSPDGVANSSGLVGRYFADHAETPTLTVVATGGAPPPIRYVDGVGPLGDAAAISHLGITDESQVRLGLPGFHARLSLLPLPFPDDRSALAVSALVDPGGARPEYGLALNVGIDVVPNPESRVTLGGGRNELGERTAEVSWQLTDDDEAAMTAIVGLLARRLALLGVGRLDTRPPAGTWRDSVVGQHHHMGTLRMSASPSAGVVDPDLRAHDVPNLYVVGSAVFPTYGHVNPTLNISALSLRLAEHLADTVVR